MRIVRRAVLLTVVAAVLAGCGSDGTGNDEDFPPPPTAATTPLPKFDSATKREAQKVLDRARDQLVSAGDISFKSTVQLFGVTFTLKGGVDIAHEASESSVNVGGDSVAELAGGDTALEFRVLRKHVYESLTFGPFDRCWFDFGDSNPLFAGNETPWLHIAVGAVTDSRALGFVEGDQSVVVVRVPAIELLSLASAKLATSIAEQMPEEIVYAPAVVKIADQRYSSLRFNVDEAASALQDAGVEVVAGVSSLPEMQGRGEVPPGAESMIKAYLTATQTVKYAYRKPVRIKAPSADELMDASDITGPEDRPDGEPELCAAAG